MFKAARRHFNATSLVAVMALVLAMTGGAYAAGIIKITSIKQISPKVLKQLVGKAGANGAPGASGAAGAQGPAGPAGPQGPAGATGLQGEKGAQGEPGKPGKNGTNGKDGEPWSPNSELPKNATETGTWIAVPTGTNLGAQISFPVKLEHELDASHVHLISTGGKEIVFETSEIKEKTQSTCTGNAEGPTAPSGHLCIYISQAVAETVVTQFIHNPTKPKATSTEPTEGTTGASTTGALMMFLGAAPEVDLGTWAVTG